MEGDEADVAPTLRGLGDSLMPQGRKEAAAGAGTMGLDMLRPGCHRCTGRLRGPALCQGGRRNCSGTGGKGLRLGLLCHWSGRAWDSPAIHPHLTGK